MVREQASNASHRQLLRVRSFVLDHIACMSYAKRNERAGQVVPRVRLRSVLFVSF